MTDPVGIPPASGHGGDATQIAIALGLAPTSMIDLSASMNPFAPDVAGLIVRILSDDPGLLGRYPNAAEATQAFADATRIDADCLVLTNGGAEAIALVADEVKTGDIIEPEFSLYRRHLVGVDATAPRWRSNPSNPLGMLAASTDIAGVWDEAFYPIATGEWTRGDTDAWRVGSLTKLWNCPGLRLGYAVAPDGGSAERLRCRQPQWAVNALALALVPELLRATELHRWHAEIAQLRDQFVTELSVLGFRVRTTETNWVLIERPGLRNELAPYGVVVRDCSSFGLPGIHRVALPAPTQFGRVIAAFARVSAC
jgi:histidinol-phosphate/aromatic aminotransferase/cobyric acid decarboxylase-like protein